MRKLALLTLFTLCSCCSTPSEPNAHIEPLDATVTEPSDSSPTVSLRGQWTIALQPLGQSLHHETVKLVRAALTTFYGVRVITLPNIPLPKGLYFKPRNRYSGSGLLDLLAKKKPAEAEKILGLTAVDIYHPNDKSPHWGVLGLGSLDGSSCVISIRRAKKGAKNMIHARERFAKTAVHEIGHTLNLSHCETQGCLMEDAKGKVSTTDGEYALCSRCRARLETSGRTLPENPTPPWPSP